MRARSGASIFLALLLTFGELALRVSRHGEGECMMEARRVETVAGSLHDSAARQSREMPSRLTCIQPGPAANPALKYSAVSASVQYR